MLPFANTNNILMALLFAAATIVSESIVQKLDFLKKKSSSYTIGFHDNDPSILFGALGR